MELFQSKPCYIRGGWRCLFPFFILICLTCLSGGQLSPKLRSEALVIYVRFDEEDGDFKLHRVYCGKKVDGLKEVKSLNLAGSYAKLAKRAGASGVLIVNGGSFGKKLGTIARKSLSLLDRPESLDSVTRFVKENQITIDGVEIDLLKGETREIK